IESVLNVPSDSPADLILPGRKPIPVSIVSVDGLLVVISVEEDLGEFVPHGRLQNNPVFSLRKLIQRIEELRDHPNPAARRLLGQVPSTGRDAALERGDLSPDQAAAVCAAVGRDATFIWGPPGTGKTRAIGAVGAELYGRRQSILVVSHTNSAVDQALMRVA